MTTAPATLHERLGGTPAVARLVEAFYAAMERRPEARAIRAMHEADLTEPKRVLAGYLREFLSRPDPAGDDRGMPALARRHAPFAIDAAAESAWLDCMAEALKQLPVDEAARREALAAFEAVARRMRNR